MKATIRSVIVLLLATIFIGACNKKEDEEEVVIPPTNTQLLTGNLWMMTDIKLDPLGISVWDSVPACEKDNLIDFMSDGSGSFDNGALKCDSAQAQVEQFSWQWLNNGSDLEVITSQDTLLFTKVQITSTTMKGKTKQEQMGGLVNVVVHFTKQ
ncbi:MAG: hypothetical protein RIC15_05315 [Vicingaceae bacterium]